MKRIRKIGVERDGWKEDKKAKYIRLIAFGR